MSRIEYTTIEMLEKLIGFDTTSSKSNMDLINFIKDYLSSHGIESHLIANDDNSKANCLQQSGHPPAAGLACPGIPMLFRHIAKTGSAIRLCCAKRRQGFWPWVMRYEGFYRGRTGACPEDQGRKPGRTDSFSVVI